MYANRLTAQKYIEVDEHASDGVNAGDDIRNTSRYHETGRGWLVRAAPVASAS